MIKFNNNVKKNYINLLAGEIGTKIVNYVVFILVIKSLNTNKFGEYTIAFVILNLSGLIINFGLEATSVYLLQKFKNNFIVYQNIFIKSVLFFLLIPVQFLFIKFFISTENNIIILLIILSSLPNIFDLSFYFKFHEKMGSIALIKFVSSLFYLILLTIFFSSRISLGLTFILFSFLASRIAGISLQYFIFFKKFKLSKFQINFLDTKIIVSRSFPIFLSSLMIWIYYQADIFYIDYFQNKTDVAIYSAAYKIILLLNIIQNIYNQSIFPRLVKSNSKSSLSQLSEKYFNQFYFIGLSVIIFALIFSNTIFIFLGKSYSDSIIAFDILLFALFIIFNESVFAPLLLARGKNSSHLVAVTSGAVINLILNYLSIPKYGYIGAAISTICAEVFVFSFLLFYTKKIINIKYRKPLLKVLLGLLLVFLIFLFKYEVI